MPDPRRPHAIKLNLRPRRDMSTDKIFDAAREGDIEITRAGLADAADADMPRVARLIVDAPLKRLAEPQFTCPRVILRAEGE